MEVVQLLGSQVLWQLQVCRELEVRRVGDMVLFGFSLASGSSAAVGIYCGSGVATWNTGPHGVPGTQGSQRPLVQEIWGY